MKKLFLTGFLSLSITCLCQELKVGEQFTLSSPAKIIGLEDKTDLYDPILKKPNYLGEQYKYKIVSIDKDTVVTVKISPNFDTIKPKMRPPGVVYMDEYYNDKLFKITKKEFVTKAEDKAKYDLPDRFNIGILTLPFKFRPQDEKSFDSEFNLNSTLACRITSILGSHFYVQVGAGIGGVELNTVNSKNIIDDATIKANALSMLAGVMLQYKKVQAGFYIGTDYINNQAYYQWRYQGKPWFGFGVGYSVFNVGLGKSEENNK